MATLVKRTYAIPEDLAESFEKSVPAGKRSAVLVQLIGDWIDRRKREALRENVIAGCTEMADVQMELEQEFHPLEAEAARGVQEDWEGNDGGKAVAGQAVE